MGFGRKSWRERLAQEPEISLLSTAFNLPTPRDLDRDERRRAARDGRNAPRALEVTRSPGRRIQIQLEPTSDDGDATNYSVTSVEESDLEQSIVSSADGDDDGDDDHEVDCSNDSNDDDDDEEEDEDSEATMVCTSAQSSGPNGSGARTTESRIAAPPTPCLKRSEGHDTQLPNAPRPSHRESRRLRKKSTASLRLSTVTGGHGSATLPAPHSVSAAAQPVSVCHSCSAFPELPLQTAYSVQTPHYFYQHPQLARAPNQFPTSVPQYTPGYAAQPMFASEVHGSSYPNPSYATPAPPARVETRAPTRQFSTELQQIQHSMDQARAKLSQNPGDSGLQQDMQVLQNQLNSTLNNATAQPGFGIPPAQSSPVTSANKPQAPEHETKDRGKPPGAVPEQVTNAPPDQIHAEYSAILKEQPMPRVCPVQLRNESPGRVIRHHLCSGCSDIRSAKFHSKHPIVPGHKPLLNYCSPCKEAKIESGIITEPHHFCFGCGVVRSKAFQRRHAATMEEPLQPNYCGKCTREVRETESMVDSSIVNSVSYSGNSRRSRIFTNQYQEFEPSRGKVQRQAPIWSPSLEGGKEEAEDAERRAIPEASPSNNTEGEKISLQQRRQRRAKRSSKIVPVEQLRLTTNSPSLSNASAVPTSSFCPDRRHGSAQRRAQRSAMAQGEDFISPISATSDKTVYHRPYVEDAEAATLAGHFNASRKSPFEANKEKKRSGSSQESSDQKSTPKSCLRGTEEDSEPDACSPPIFESPPNNRRQDSTALHSVDSSGNKTVKFRPTVKVRHSSTRQSSNTSSHAEIRETVISPADQTTPTRTGIYGNSPPPLSDGGTPALRFRNAGDDWPFENDEASPTSASNAHRQGQPPEIIRTSPDPEIPTRFSRGAFGLRPGSAGNIWTSPSMDMEGAGQDIPSNSYRRSSPLAEGFPPDVSGMFDSLPSGGGYEDPPYFRSSRGTLQATLGQTDETKPTHLDLYPPARTSERLQRPPAITRSDSALIEPTTGGTRTTAAESSTFRGYNSSSGAGSRTKHDEGSYGSYSEHTSSSDNPYYKPSRFANVQNLFNQNTQSWGSGLGRGGQSRGGTVPDDQVPEPIIEEPDSPPDSPVQRMKLLEFRVQVVTDSSTESEEDAPEIEDLPSDNSLDEETENEVNPRSLLLTAGDEDQKASK
ncbi:Uncharacterized protein TPAR_07810 [Tolypocladium paradoxum]|uniref:Uncharacterized protein n=1 Tax=Tolypocladium paradoxum TaxID=94208 RepID=A0A2S4KP62_9HYPO|nr:Uncharacterized protein TPAR_07810 [Tolypocladium paradoxum]